MIDITHKRTTQRRAVAEAKVYCSAATRQLVEDKKIPKGDIFGISRAAGLLAIKNTPHLLPFCHPIPVEYADIAFTLEADGIRIRVEAECIARTGIEVETMTAASIVALNVYDMLKPVDDAIRIGDIRVIEKSGGKGDFGGKAGRQARAAVILCGDDYVARRRDDTAGRMAVEILAEEGVEVVSFDTVGDAPETIAVQLKRVRQAKVDFVFTVGGTGLGPKDTVVDVVRAECDRDVPGISEAMRQHGLDRTPYAALSRSYVGQAGPLLFLALPGSTGGVRESLDALFPWLLHVVKVFDKTYKM